MTHDLFILELNSKAQHFQFSFTLSTKSVLSELSSLNSMLTSNDIDFGEEDYTKVVDNFDNFPENINTPLSDEWFRSNGFWKLRGATGNSSFLDRLTWTDSFGVRVFIPMNTEKMHNTNIVGYFRTFPKSGKMPDFTTGQKSSRRRKLRRSLDRVLT
jgi:hypothetical protein